jgi:hypothetical protein
MVRNVISPSVTLAEDAVVREERSAHCRSIFVWGVYLLSFGLIAWFFVNGYSYYVTPYLQRPHHPDYRLLRPAGSYGLTYGIAGSAMMILMLIYSVRKRTRLLGRTMPLRPLLDLHIYLGVIGPLLILLHTSFKVQGLVAVSFWSMVAVAVSGYFGRYLYVQIPRNIAGNELTLQEMEHTNTEMAQSLRERFNLDEETFRRVETLFARGVVHKQKGALASVAALFIDDVMRPITRRKLRRQLMKIVLLPKNQFKELFDMSFRRALLRRRIALLGQVQMLFHYWHVIHKPFAIVMYIIMGIHIGVALWTGYAWIK